MQGLVQHFFMIFSLYSSWSSCAIGGIKSEKKTHGLKAMTIVIIKVENDNEC